jgi:hypothetical protein
MSYYFKGARKSVKTIQKKSDWAPPERLEAPCFKIYLLNYALCRRTRLLCLSLLSLLTPSTKASLPAWSHNLLNYLLISSEIAVNLKQLFCVLFFETQFFIKSEKRKSGMKQAWKSTQALMKRVTWQGDRLSSENEYYAPTYFSELIRIKAKLIS